MLRFLQVGFTKNEIESLMIFFSFVFTFFRVGQVKFCAESLALKSKDPHKRHLSLFSFFHTPPLHFSIPKQFHKSFLVSSFDGSKSLSAPSRAVAACSWC